MMMPSVHTDVSVPEPKKGLIDVVREAASRVASSSGATTDSSQSSTSPSAVESWIQGLNLEPVTSLSASHGLIEDDFREYNFSKSFPFYRKQFIHATQPRTAVFLGKSAKTTYVSAISPDCTKFCIANRQRWSLYAIAQDYNDGPILLHSEPMPDARRPSTSTNSAGSAGGSTNTTTISTDATAEAPPQVDASSTPMVSMNNDFVAVATPQGAVRVYSLASNPLLPEDDHYPNFPLVYSYQSPFGIHCLALSPRSAILAYSIIGRDKVTKDTQPIIMLHCPSTPRFESIVTVSYTSPYRDPIKGLTFSSDESFLACCTYSESRFMVISVADLHTPRLVMKSSRRVDVSTDYEGVTSIQFFPGNSRYMSVTSVADKAPPVLLDTKCAPGARSFNSGSSGLSHPTVLMRVDKVGSSIHRAEVSPRGDAVAFLDKSGLVYLMHAPGMLSDMRKITIVSEVAGATNARAAASMRFTPSGHTLILVDRKGNLHIEDFAAGIPHQSGMGKCRVLG